MYKKLKWFKYLQIALLSVVLATLAGVLGFFGSELVTELMPYLPYLELAGKKTNGTVYTRYLILLWFIVALVFCWLLNLAYKLTTDVIGTNANMTPALHEKKYSVLISGLSIVRKLDPVKKHKNFPLEELVKSDEEFNNYVDKLKEAGKEYPADRVSWQQNLRSIYHHEPKLKKLIILPSDESREFFEDFKDYINHFYPNLIIETVKSEIDITEDYYEYDPNIGVMGDQERAEKRNYESYNYVVGGLEMAISQSGVTDSNICIDSTSGNKIFSIGAAIVTLNRSIKFSYVENSGAVKFYDASVELVNLFK